MSAAISAVFYSRITVQPIAPSSSFFSQQSHIKLTSAGLNLEFTLNLKRAGLGMEPEYVLNTLSAGIWYVV